MCTPADARELCTILSIRPPVNGFLPSYLRGKLTGFECNSWNVKDVMAEYRGVDSGRHWSWIICVRIHTSARPKSIECF